MSDHAQDSRGGAVATAGRAAVEETMEQYRVELRGYCYRMLGSAFDAEDAVQETFVRAWRHADQFEGRATVRSWLYRIATNVCLDMLSGRERRARPMDLGPVGRATAPLDPPLAESVWITPVADASVLPPTDDPAELVVAKETIRLAFIAALQLLPPRQRAVLILREVLHWHADEVAGLLDTTLASVNSALQRARATLASVDTDDGDTADPTDPGQRELLDRYVDAFERYDMDALLQVIHEDATQTMPPYAMWLRGHEDLRTWYTGPGAECAGSRLVPVSANGKPAFAQYRPSGLAGRHEAWALVVLGVTDGVVVELHFFLDTEQLYPLFGLPMALES